MRAFHVRVGHHDLARRGFLLEQLDADDLIEQPAVDLDPAGRPAPGRRRAPRWSGSRVRTRASRCHVAIDSREHVRQFRRHRLRRRGRRGRGLLTGLAPAWAACTAGGAAPEPAPALAPGAADSFEHPLTTVTTARKKTRLTRDTRTPLMQPRATAARRSTRSTRSPREHRPVCLEYAVQRAILNVLFGLQESVQVRTEPFSPGAR